VTDIEPKEVFRQIGIDLINEYRVRGGFKPIDWLAVKTPEASAFIRSIQLHEKTKQELAEFKQEVSDAAEMAVEAIVEWSDDIDKAEFLHQFIIPKPKPDPLVDIVEWLGGEWEPEEYVKEIRAALAARGLEIREKNDD
jgi:hypothetical protein